MQFSALKVYDECHFLLIQDSSGNQKLIVYVINQMKRRLERKTELSDRWVFDQSVCVGSGLWFNSHNREVSTIKMSSDNGVKESSVSFYSYRFDVNFK